ncbi:dTDP-4-amino-4,6-dideoxygalactose transaminase [compost metagenome]
MLTINDPQFEKRAEIIWEKGTDRSAFFRGEIDKYGWVDLGSSFLPSEVIAAFLWAQVENIEDIQKRRIEHWDRYYNGLKDWARKSGVRLPVVPDFCANNAHMFYLVCESIDQRVRLIDQLKRENILAVFHYLSLHKSPYYFDKHDGRRLAISDNFSDCLIRLPLFYEITNAEIDEVMRILINN